MKRLSSLFRPKTPPIHSHAITQATAPTTFGSTSAESFSQRIHIDKNRQTVANYREASIHQTDESVRSELSIRANSRRVNFAETDRQDRSPATSASRGDRVTRPQITGAPQVAYREPASRKYNPYK